MIVIRSLQQTVSAVLCDGGGGGGRGVRGWRTAFTKLWFIHGKAVLLFVNGGGGNLCASAEDISTRITGWI